MSKRTHFTTVTPLPAGISRQTVLETLHNHVEMIDLNPLVIERHPIKPPKEAAPEEINCSWYAVTDKVSYIPGLYSGKLTFNACFNDLPDGLQSHIYAPMGLDMRGRWSIGGSLPGEPRQNVEIGHGIPKSGLYLREDVDMKVNFTMTKFVKGTTKKTHHTLVERLVEKAHNKEGEAYNNALAEQIDLRNQVPPDYHSSQASTSGMASPAATPYIPDQKPPMQNHPSFNGGSLSPHRMPSYHDSKQGYIAPGMPSPVMQPAMPGQPHMQQGYPYQQYPQQYPGQQYPQHPMGMPMQMGGYGAQGGMPPQHGGPSFSAELPSEQAQTPIEIGSSAAGPPQQHPPN